MPRIFQDIQNHFNIKKDILHSLVRDDVRLLSLIFFLIIIATVFRFYDLGKDSLWYDETYTWWCIDKPWIDMFNSLRNPGAEVPLFYVLIKLTSQTLQSTTEWVLRFPSALTGVMGVIIAMLIGYHNGGKAGLLAGGWLWTFHPFTIWYSRDVKTYSLTALLAGCLTLVYLHLLKKDHNVLWFLAGVLLSLGLLSHYFFFLLAGSLIMIALMSIRERPIFFRKWVLLTFISLIPVALWVMWFMSHPSPTLGSGWIEKPDWNDPVETVWNLMSGYAGQNSVHNTAFGLFVLLLFLIGLRTKDKFLASFRILIFGLVVPIAGMWIISQYRPLYVDRYFIVLLPFITIIISRGAEGLVLKIRDAIQPRETSKWLIILLVTIPSILGLWVGYSTLRELKYSRESWRDLYSDLSAEISLSSNIWLSDPFLILPLKYYFFDDYNQITSSSPPVCKEPCWWILRQNFTYTHAFTQSINPSNRPWVPIMPDGCAIIKQYNYNTGIKLWLLDC
jgi:4-amino-4-deoxy-L-arabinose transferase-like glycosyltransferase